MRVFPTGLLLVAGVSVAALSTVASARVEQRTGVFDQSMNHPAIKYSTSDSNTVVDELNRKLADGSATLVFDEKTGYLKSVLDLLNIPVESQVLVYTQTSQQSKHITMTNPRAIYFNDEASVGYIRGAGLLEIVAQDAKLGSIFYVVHQDAGAARRFGREQQCLRCHLSWDTLGVPGMSVLSTFPRANESEYANGFFVDHYRQIRERWGGWYVTGTRVPPRHLGNLPLILPKPPAAPPGGRVSLEGQFDLTGYLTPYSDVVALMVLEHQVHFSNLVTRATWEARLGNEMRVAEAAGTLADYLLFVDEAPITEGPIAGSSGFTEVFVAKGRKDANGRSLRELDLKTRLQKYPLSYMIYSPQFQALPEAPKNLVIGRINDVLSGKIAGPKYAHLTPALRTAIREILSATL
jgi:hypothetical protein